MFKKDVRISAFISLAVSVAFFAVWPLYDYQELTMSQLPWLNSSFANAVESVTMVLVMLLGLVNMGLVIWELIIGFQSKRHYWLVYVLFGIVILMFVIMAVYHPYVSHPSCGCGT